VRSYPWIAAAREPIPAAEALRKRRIIWDSVTEECERLLPWRIKREARRAIVCPTGFGSLSSAGSGNYGPHGLTGIGPPLNAVAIR